MLFKRANLYYIIKNLFFTKKEFGYTNNPIEKQNLQSEEKDRRTLFVDLRLKGAIIVDTAKSLVALETTLNDQCPICQYNFPPKELISGLHCGHLFHARCLRESFQMEFEESKQSCPICDKVILSGKYLGSGDGIATQMQDSSNNIGISINELRQSNDQMLYSSSLNAIEPYISNDQNVDIPHVETEEGEAEPDKDADITGEF